MWRPATSSINITSTSPLNFVVAEAATYVVTPL